MPSARATRSDPTFIQSARRSQLVGCAIDVIADVGVEKASLVRIADQAGISRGVISYHFASRQALLDAVMAEVYALGATEVSPAVAAAGSRRQALGAFTTGSVRFYASHPRPMTALSAIFASGHVAEVPARDERSEHGAEMLDVEGILADGQRRGDFRDFDTAIMAMTVRAALDAAVWRVDGGGDQELVGEERRRTFDAATRSE